MYPAPKLVPKVVDDQPAPTPSQVDAQADYYARMTLAHGKAAREMAGLSPEEWVKVTGHRAYQKALKSFQDEPESVLPSHAELYAMYVHIAHTADRTADKLRALDILTSLKGTPSRNASLTKIAGGAGKQSLKAM